MTHSGLSQPPNLDADPFEIQIGSLVIMHRAGLLRHGRFTHNELVEASNDYQWYGDLLQRLTGKATPWDENAEYEVTPPQVFYETADLVGLTQAMPNPSLGMEARHFRLCHRGDAEESKFGPTPWLSNSLAVVNLVQHPNGGWQVLHAEVADTHRRQGIATTLYDRIEVILGTKLEPSDWLSDDAYQFWRARSCLEDGYRQMEHLPGLWLSAKAIKTLRDIAVARASSRRSGSRRPRRVGSWRRLGRKLMAHLGRR